MQLRKRGLSMRTIAARLGVAKSSVSYWVRDIQLTVRQQKQLNENGYSVAAIEKRRISRIANTKKRQIEIMRRASEEVPELLLQPLWCIGVSLYWGVGGKTQQTARLSNSDPVVIKVMMRFFGKYSGVPIEKYRGHVHTFAHTNVERAVSYWSMVSGIPKDKFYKTHVKQSRASKKKRDTLPHGTMQIYVHDSIFFFRVMGWIERIKQLHSK